MSNDSINSWIAKAKSSDSTTAQPQGVIVIKCPAAANKGRVIMDVAEKIRPYLMKMYEGVRDAGGMLLQPAHIRALALNVAQDIVNDREAKAGA
jgi:hypothetical protein